MTTASSYIFKIISLLPALLRCEYFMIGAKSVGGWLVDCWQKIGLYILTPSRVKF